MLRNVLSVGTLIFALSTTAPAQEPTATITSGRLVKVKLVSGESYQGNLLTPGADTLSLVRPGLDTVRISRAAVKKFEVYQGEGHNVGRHAGRGAMIGGSIGLLLGALSAGAAAEDEFFDDTPAGEWVLSGLLGGAFWGAAIGTVVGLVSKAPKWKAAPLPSVSVTGGRGDPSVVRLSLNLRF